MVQHHAPVRTNPVDETNFVGVIQMRFLVTGEESHGSAANFELIVPAGAKLPTLPHRHDAFEETLYGLTGITTWTVDGVPMKVGPGQALSIPRGVVHAFANQGTVDAKLLSVISPAVIGPAFFREMGAVIAEALGGPPDRAKIAEVMQRYGLTPVLSPSA